MNTEFERPDACKFATRAQKKWMMKTAHEILERLQAELASYVEQHPVHLSATQVKGIQEKAAHASLGMMIWAPVFALLTWSLGIFSYRVSESSLETTQHMLWTLSILLFICGVITYRVMLKNKAAAVSRAAVIDDYLDSNINLPADFLERIFRVSLIQNNMLADQAVKVHIARQLVLAGRLSWKGVNLAVVQAMKFCFWAGDDDLSSRIDAINKRCGKGGAKLLSLLQPTEGSLCSSNPDTNLSTPASGIITQQAS